MHDKQHICSQRSIGSIRVRGNEFKHNGHSTDSDFKAFVRNSSENLESYSINKIFLTIDISILSIISIESSYRIDTNTSSFSNDCGPILLVSSLYNNRKVF